MTDSLLAELRRIFKVDILDREIDMKSIDSLGRAEVILLAEEVLGVELSDKQILGMKTLGDLEDILLKAVK